MTDSMISIKGLTKDYQKGRGIFDIDIDVSAGECFGYIGANGSGKTTTIRNIMGFIKPDKGVVTVKGMDAWKDALEIRKYVSYIPGEIAFPPAATGMDFLREQAAYLDMGNLDYMNHLLKVFKLDASANLARMSKGMKQKTAIVAALMGDMEILVMDEPTTGLDPLMREVFIDTINREKKKGKTIFMSGHIFEEMEELCDRVAFIRNGRIIDVVDVHRMRRDHKNTYFIGFHDSPGEMEICIEHDQVNQLFAALKNRSVRYIREESYDLEHYFNEAYKGGK